MAIIEVQGPILLKLTAKPRPEHVVEIRVEIGLVSAYSDTYWSAEYFELPPETGEPLPE